ncbi:alkane 1-monooxygenase [Erythrobacter sp. EC-HK427]|uniref:alkane 1-monooxygenase n=1 Tax=Erythrobacter sp. EC-HK427 TaxID=2038396 RepID=UPI001256CDD3|nr:alkane 1-monooxygenase [Erythrobacter sp. EC-HK427]VVT00997.1 Alkane 1-monooxygenase [Erythrobacter sp. EC-HK427]
MTSLSIPQSQTDKDNKRWLYALSLFANLIPAFALGLYFTGLGVWATLIPAIFLFVIVPVLDGLFGEDPENLSDAMLAKMSGERHYTWLVRAAVPMLWISFLATVWLIGTQDLPFWSIAALAVGVGFMIGGNGLTIGHELGHKHDKTDRRFAMWANAVVGYAHFRVEHNHGHHVWVSTPEDPASSRMGESIYRFAMREIPGAIMRGWAEEATRLARKKKGVISPDNEILRGLAITVTVTGSLIALIGWTILPFLIVHHAFGWFALTQANYIEHYGLLRQKKPNGHYEPVRQHHSWNANHRVSNLMTFHLQRHSDHHANPLRPYQILRNFPDLPRLPSGYPGMFVLATIPLLFFRVMNPRVLAWADGDLSRINIAPHARARIVKKYQDRAGASDPVTLAAD